MEIEEAIRHALDGDAILFLGAGFSLAARNKTKDGVFPLANDLSAHLMVELGDKDVVPLQTAAEVFVQRKGEVALLSYLNLHLGVQSVAPWHEKFAVPRWRRIWTTNYDAVMELAGFNIGKTIRPLALAPSIPQAESGTIDCVHINGYLPWANVQNLDSTLVLSETAILTNRFAESPWAALFRSDMDAARAVVFAGYSVADLDITRILVAVESLQRKCVFIVGPNPGLASRTTIGKFGRIAPLAGTEAAANTIAQIIKTHTPQQRRVEFSSFRRLEVKTDRRPTPTAKDVFDLYVKGRVDVELLASGLAEAKPSYCVRRSEIDDVGAAFRHGAKAVIILSRLGNGKSLLSDCIGIKLLDQFDVFIFAKDTPSLTEEIRALREPDRPTLVIIEDYPRQLGLIKELRLSASHNQYLLLTSRTPTHLTARDQLRPSLGGDSPIEFRVDALRDKELEELDFILASAGLLGSTASWSPNRRVQELYQTRGAGEFASILLWLLESEPIKRKLAETFEALKHKGDAQKVVVAAMILTHISQIPDVDDIAEFLGAAPINQIIFSEDELAADLIRYDRRVAYPRSGLFAVAALRALWNQGYVAEVLERILRRAWELRSYNRRYRDIARDLMRYSKLRQIVPTDEPSRYVHAYYERIRNLPPCVNNELFWLQFALSEIERKHFDLVERHLKQSYAIASRMRGYDTYQIDNVWALMLLLREIEERKPDRAYSSFVEASKIIGRQTRERRHAYYPFRVATHYGLFWKTLAIHWEGKERATFIEACLAVFRSLQAVDPDLSAMDDIGRCRYAITTVLKEAGAMPVS